MISQAVCTRIVPLLFVSWCGCVQVGDMGRKSESFGEICAGELDAFHHLERRETGETALPLTVTSEQS